LCAPYEKKGPQCGGGPCFVTQIGAAILVRLRFFAPPVRLASFTHRRMAGAQRPGQPQRSERVGQRSNFPLSQLQALSRIRMRGGRIDPRKPSSVYRGRHQFDASVAAMPTYSFYLLKPEGKLESAGRHEYSDDHDALSHVKSVVGSSTIEVWEGIRMAFRVHPDGAITG